MRLIDLIDGEDGAVAESGAIKNVEVTGLTQEGLLGEVVVLVAVGELPGVAAIGLAGQLGLDGPAGEGPGSLADVYLGVVADAHGEQLQELTSPSRTEEWE